MFGPVPCVRILWYWPFARAEELPLAHAVAGSDDEIVVQVIDREAAPEAGMVGRVEVRRDLPDVDRKVGRIWWAPSRALTYQRRLVGRSQLEANGGFELVHHQYANRFTDGWRRPRVPWVLSVHDVVPHHLRGSEALEHRNLRRLYRRPDALVVHHRWLGDRLVADFGVDGDRIHVVPHQVFSVPNPPGPNRPEGVPLVLFFGALRPNKGLDVLGQAIEIVDPAAMRFHIAGRGDAVVEAQATALASAHHNVTAEIGFVPLERKYELFREASVVVLPYRRFGSQSGVLHDAYGHGRPVVVTDAGALGDTVREDGAGCVAAFTPASIAAELETALDRWSILSQAAFRAATSRSPEACGTILRELYARLARERRSTP